MLAFIINNKQALTPFPLCHYREVDIVMKYAFSGASTNFQRNEHTQLYFLR
jgi:hypothetical protein